MTYIKSDMLKLLINSVFLIQNGVRIVFSDKVLVNVIAKQLPGRFAACKRKPSMQDSGCLMRKEVEYRAGKIRRKYS